MYILIDLPTGYEYKDGKTKNEEIIIELWNIGRLFAQNTNKYYFVWNAKDLYFDSMPWIAMRVIFWRNLHSDTMESAGVAPKMNQPYSSHVWLWNKGQ